MVDARDFIREWPPTQYDTDDTPLSGLSNTDYETGSVSVGVYFVAAVTERALITVGGGMYNGDGSSRAFLAPELHADGPNGEILAAPDVDLHGFGIPQNATATYFGSRGTLFTAADGLEAGLVYYVRVMHRVASGSSGIEIVRRDIMVEPAP